MEPGLPRTAHFLLPRTGRPLCGHEEEGDAMSAQSGTAVACPECVVLLQIMKQRRPLHA